MGDHTRKLDHAAELNFAPAAADVRCPKGGFPACSDAYLIDYWGIKWMIGKLILGEMSARKVLFA